MRFPRLLLFLAPLAMLSVAGCGSPSNGGSPDAVRDAAPSGTLVLTGSSTVAPLAQEIGQRFEAQNPVARIDVQTGGSSRGIADARNETADVGMVSRALKPNEADLTAHTIAHDGICVILHADNPVAALSDDQVRSIYRGEVSRWSAVGGGDTEITVVNKAEGRSTLELFLEYYVLENREIAADVVIGDNEQGIKTVASNPAAIGYVSIGAAEFAAQDGVPIKLLPLNGVAASTANLKNGTFPLARPLNLVTKGAPGNLARAYIEFAQSAEVVDLVTGLYYVPAR